MLQGFFVALFVTISFAAEAQDINYGLYFKSYANLGKDRTSLVLNNGDALKIDGETALSFDLYIRKELEFGYVVHLIGEGSNCIALNFSPDSNNNRYPSLIINGGFYPVSNKVELEKWLAVKLRFSAHKDSLYVSYDGVEKSYPLSSSGWEAIKVVFGVCRFHDFETFEVASMNIRDVKLSRRETLIRHWALKEHNDSICYDLVDRVPAIVENPRWIIDSHTNWKKLYTKEFKNNNNPQYAFDSQRNLFYIVPDEKTIIAYNPVADRDSMIPVKSGYPASISTNGLIYDHLKDELVSYSLDEKTISRFSFANREWSKNTPGKDETRFWHHTVSINNADTSLVAFGGYGYYRYKNDLFTVHLNSDVWKKDQLLLITPRYTSASAIVDNQLYIFGGRGSETGKQEVNSRFYFDMYSVDLATGATKLLWQTQQDPTYLPCGNMIYNPSDTCFYVLTNIDNGTLLRLNTHHSAMEKVSGGINQSLTADFLFYTLYLAPGQQKIYALFCKDFKSGTSEIAIYEIDFPPLSQSEISQAQYAVQPSFSWKIVAGVCLLLLLAGVIFLFVSKKRKNKTVPEKPVFNLKAETPVVENPSEIDETVTETKVNIYDRTKQCISLLGGFNVMDKDGNNSTPSFTPILKSLLLLILLYNEKGEKGINDKKIDSLLWSDKEDKAARNNRNVSLTRLKSLLENIGDITLLNNSGFWKVSFGENVFCDYHASMAHIRQFKTNDIDKNSLDELQELLMYGQLLPYTQADWLDKFKSDYSNDAIDILYNLLCGDIIKDEKLKLQIADTIFLFDSLNEEALAIKCSILYNSGKKGLAKTTYDVFAKEYKALLGEDFPNSLQQVLENTKNK
ncbi:hypothetical protein FACS1894176_08540 [Bacteroidia bacterium]|nr:hypothetical protein FACS1894176_08540 [Bacteroidia bacterium]